MDALIHFHTSASVACAMMYIHFGYEKKKLIYKIHLFEVHAT